MAKKNDCLCIHCLMIWFDVHYILVAVAFARNSITARVQLCQSFSVFR